ncbi:tetraacyldisaccharide 4'-kinase [bacterium]|nr:tetraacyldisaccharide 4'-kinase [bacterium]
MAAAARAGLWAASWPYRAGVWWRNRSYDRGRRPVHRAGVPVVSVGNLTLGGTGKTPCVEYVAGFYRDRGLRAAIVSRGYGAGAGPNDEALVLEENVPDVPHLQDADRVAAARRAVEELESEVLVLDDGFQHRRLHRDLDVVLIDATLPPWCDQMFPRGSLREPEGSLRRAGAVLLTRCDQAAPADVTAARDRIRARFPGLPVATSEHRPLELLGGDEPEPVEHLRGRRVAGFAGIGNPPAFQQTLRGLGGTVVGFRSYPDHHNYTRADVDDLRDWARGMHDDVLMVTTQKDWVKLRLPDLAGRPLRAVRVGIAFRDGQDAFDAELARVAPEPTDD